MKRNKKRSSILKRVSISSNENPSPSTEAITGSTTAKSSKRISFSGKSKVKEFADGDDCITIWNNSYEKSAEHCSTAVSSIETTTGSSMIVKSELPILSGPNKENIIMDNDFLVMASVNNTLSTTLQFENTAMAANNFLYKSPGKNEKKTEEIDKNIENDSMELEDIGIKNIRASPTSFGKKVVDGDISFINNPEFNSETKSTESDTNSEMSLELFCGELNNGSFPAEKNHRTVVFEKEELEISEIEEQSNDNKVTSIRTSMFDKSIPSTDNAKKRNRRQTKVELHDMDVSSETATPIAPAKRDRRETILDSNSIDITLKPCVPKEPHKEHRKTIIQTDDMNETLPGKKVRKTIVFQNENMMEDVSIACNSRNGEMIKDQTLLTLKGSASCVLKPSKYARESVYATQEMNETLYAIKEDKKTVEQNTRARANEERANEESTPRRETIYTAQAMNETMANDEPQASVFKTPTAEQKNNHLANERISSKTNNVPRRQTIVAAMSMDESPIVSKSKMSLGPVSTRNHANASRAQKSSKYSRESVYTAQDMNETLVDQVQEVEDICTVSRETHCYEHERSVIKQNMSEAEAKEESVSLAQDMNETMANQQSANVLQRRTTDRKTNYFDNESMVLESDKHFETQKEKKVVDTNKNNLPARTSQRMSIVPLSTLTTGKQGLKSSKHTRESVYVPQEMNETLLEQTYKSTDHKENVQSQSKKKVSKSALKRNRRQTTVETLSMEVSTLNLTPTKPMPSKRERRETVLYQQESAGTSDIDLTLENLSIETDNWNKLSSITTKSPEIKKLEETERHANETMQKTPSKIPVSTMKLGKEPKSSRAGLKDIKPLAATQPLSNEQASVNTFDIDVETIVDSPPHINLNKSTDNTESTTDHQNMLNIATENGQIENSTPDCIRRQTTILPRPSTRFSNIQMAELSTKRFQDLNHTMQNNELLDKESDINLTVNSTITEPVKSTNETVYLPCSYANITLENVASPHVSAQTFKESTKQTFTESCVCTEMVSQESSFSVSSVDGISPNISARLSLANYMVEQIRQRVLRQTPLYCKNCNCLSESCLNQSKIQKDFSEFAPMINWSRFAQVPSQICIDEIEKDYLDACEKLNYVDTNQKPEIPSAEFLLQNLRESISAEIQQEGDQFSLEARCPAPYPATKPYIYLIKNKLDSEGSPWKVARSMHAPIGVFQLRNDKMKSILLHVRIKPTSLKEKETFVYEAVEFIKNILHPPSSPFTVVLFERFVQLFPLETSFLQMCSDSKSLFDFLMKIDDSISQMHANMNQLFAILIDHNATVYIENSTLKAKLSVIEEGVQVVRVFMNLTEPSNFSPNDIRTEPEIENFRTISNGFNLKGIEFLEYFLSHIKTIVHNM